MEYLEILLATKIMFVALVIISVIFVAGTIYATIIAKKDSEAKKALLKEDMENDEAFWSKFDYES